LPIPYIYGDGADRIKGLKMITVMQASDIRVLAKNMDLLHEVSLDGSQIGFKFPDERKAKAFINEANARWEDINFDDAYGGGFVGIL